MSQYRYNNSMSRYMLVLMLSGFLPLLLSFYPRLKFYQNIPALIFSLGLTVLIFGGWDIYAVYRNHWDFDPQGVLPIRIFTLPLEEILFFIVIPFCCIFTWEVVKYFLRKKA